MREGIDDPKLAAEGELALARIALADGDLHHAAEHVGGALAHAPDLPAVHEVLAALAARAGQDARELFPIDGRVFVGTVAARAHLMAAAGDIDEALDLLARASRHAPILPWANVAWVTAPDLPARLDPDQLFRSLIAVVGAIPDPVPEQLFGSLGVYLDLAERAVVAHPDHAVLLGVCSALARKMNRVDWALSWAGRAVATEPSTMTEMWLGYAQQRAGRIDEAVASLRRAMVHDPMNFSLHADAANWLAEAGRLDDALRMAEEALAVDPDHDCAYQVACRLRFERDQDVTHLVDIADYLRARPDQPHEHTDLAAGCGSHPWLGRIPPPGEACVNVMRQFLAGAKPRGEPTMRLSDLEPPSALAAVTRALPTLRVTVDNVPAPDIRRPRRSGAVRIWHYQGNLASSPLAPPSQAAVEAMLDVAEPRLGHPIEAYDAAVRLSSLDADDLIALLAHPPRPPDNEMGRWLADKDPAWWDKCVQVWACLGLLHHRSEEPWAGSTRRQVLVDLVWGIEDWTTEAALFALVAAAWADPAVRADVAQVVAERLTDLAEVCRSRAVTIAWSVATLALRTPGLDARSLELARAIVAVNSPDDDPQWATPAPRAPSPTAGMTSPTLELPALELPGATASTSRTAFGTAPIPGATAFPGATALPATTAPPGTTPPPGATTPSHGPTATPAPRPAGVPTRSTRDESGPGGARHRRRWFGPRR